VPENSFDEHIAATYEAKWPELFDPAVVDPAVDFLADLAGDGPALEFGIGTGRIALPLAGRGIGVHGIELSAAMAARVPPDAGIEVTIGDFVIVDCEAAAGLEVRRRVATSRPRSPTRTTTGSWTASSRPTRRRTASYGPASWT
jgi:hypothetical protein